MVQNGGTYLQDLPGTTADTFPHPTLAWVSFLGDSVFRGAKGTGSTGRELSGKRYQSLCPPFKSPKDVALWPLSRTTSPGAKAREGRGVTCPESPRRAPELKLQSSFDIWGDAVNCASRMESTRIPEVVQAAQSTWDYVQD